MFKKTLMLGAVLLGLAGAVNANEFDSSSPIYQFYLDHMVQRYTFMDSSESCVNYSDEEKVKLATDGLHIIVDSYLKERSLVAENLNLITERDFLVSKLAERFSPDCNSIIDPVHLSGFKDHTIARANWDFKFIESVLAE
jgi:hypothetical protein